MGIALRMPSTSLETWSLIDLSLLASSLQESSCTCLSRAVSTCYKQPLFVGSGESNSGPHI